ncbi:hypothetical protein, partial [Bacillus sp. WP8]|uniref:hypothetical protein n=1 Tax=Bacillus sp. WP8 TaxID=756828 RepID=UPI001C92C056
MKVMWGGVLICGVWGGRIVGLLLGRNGEMDGEFGGEGVREGEGLVNVDGGRWMMFWAGKVL